MPLENRALEKNGEIFSIFVFDPRVSKVNFVLQRFSWPATV